MQAAESFEYWIALFWYNCNMYRIAEISVWSHLLVL